MLRLHDLKMHFPVTRGVLRREVVGWIRAVDGVSLDVQKGQTLGLVGESGCGKTTLMRLVLGMLRPTEGRVEIDGEDVHGLRGDRLREYRRRVQVVFQDPYSSLNPRMRIDRIIREALESWTPDARDEQIVRQRVAQVLDLVGLHTSHARLYPHQFSGGQRQRIALARAIAPDPELILLDEPTSALDVSIRAQVLNLLKDLQRSADLTYLLISHDLQAVRYMSDTIAVMYLGKIVEFGAAQTIHDSARHPYTRLLLMSSEEPILQGDEEAGDEEAPSAMAIPSGCRFRTRCPMVMPRCADEEPSLRLLEGRWVACHLY